jgi:hypothetical protein
MLGSIPPFSYLMSCQGTGDFTLVSKEVSALVTLKWTDGEAMDHNEIKLGISGLCYGTATYRAWNRHRKVRPESLRVCDPQLILDIHCPVRKPLVLRKEAIHYLELHGQVTFSSSYTLPLLTSAHKFNTKQAISKIVYMHYHQFFAENDSQVMLKIYFSFLVDG